MITFGISWKEADVEPADVINLFLFICRNGERLYSRSVSTSQTSTSSPSSLDSKKSHHTFQTFLTTSTINMVSITSIILSLGLLSAGVSAANCSVKGYDTGAHPAFIVNNTVSTAPACKGLCTAYVTPKCSSFAVGPGNCLLYNVTVAGNVNPMNTSTFTF